MDHRATQQRNEINATQHKVLANLGGKISEEMHLPKILWLKQNMPETFEKIAKFFDLADFLVYKATHASTRSFCTVVCKCCYSSDDLWPRDLLDAVQLPPSLPSRLGGSDVVTMGSAVGGGLSEEASKQLGLPSGTPVGAAAIDAYAGALGVWGAYKEVAVGECMALIAGTSACHLVCSGSSKHTLGIWGPYPDVVPGHWILEGGQSACGALLDHVIASHALGVQVDTAANSQGVSRFEYLNLRISHLAAAKQLQSPVQLLPPTLHINPDFHGNRSPLADPLMCGAITGLRLQNDVDTLALMYLAAVVGLALGTRQIIEQMRASGSSISVICVTGGLAKNGIFLQAVCDATGCTVAVPSELDSVLLGSAMLGSIAAKHHQDMPAAMRAMSSVASVVLPNPAVAEIYNLRYRMLLRMQSDQMDYRNIMALKEGS
eukprot:c11851_g1_i3.p1 GENE.c11851_g1_i3~~c11851_g1_i3.p1  ORF type:complete len:433 (+),score=104.89 c11851_g1_i3:249-1547(+)